MNEEAKTAENSEYIISHKNVTRISHLCNVLPVKKGEYDPDNIFICDQKDSLKEDCKNYINKNKNFNISNPEFIKNQNIVHRYEKLNDISELIKKNAICYCPICFKKNNFEQASSLIVHLKSCAAKNNVSTEQLLVAIELQQKQTTERKALGLPAVTKVKPSNKRKDVKKGHTDSNLELAMALSASLRESEMVDKIRKTESLLEAGLEQEALSQCKQLEDYGFVTSKPFDSISQKRTNHMKNSRNTVLFTRSQEERERIITEKIGIILLDFDSQSSSIVSETKSSYCDLKSKFLNKHKREGTTLWDKSNQFSENVNNECFYVENLSCFISPSETKVGAKLKNLSQIPCRPVSPGKNRPISANRCKNVFFKSLSPKQDTIKKNLENKSGKPKNCETFIDLKFSEDWKCILNKNFMSDLTIYVTNERSVFAHKLVLYVRCRQILSDVIKETDKNKTSEIIMWLDYCYDAVLTFLEYIYTGSISNLDKLTKKQLRDLKVLCSRYHFKELKDVIDTKGVKDTMFFPDEDVDHFNTSDEDLRNLKMTNGCNFKLRNEIKNVENKVYNNSINRCSENMKDDKDTENLSTGENNLMLLQMALQTQETSRNTVYSPEIIEEENIIFNLDKSDEFTEESDTKNYETSMKMFADSNNDDGLDYDKFNSLNNPESPTNISNCNVKQADYVYSDSNDSQNYILNVCNNSPENSNTFNATINKNNLSTSSDECICKDQGEDVIIFSDEHSFSRSPQTIPSVESNIIHSDLMNYFKDTVIEENVEDKFSGKRTSSSPLEKNKFKKTKNNIFLATRKSRIHSSDQADDDFNTKGNKIKKCTGKKMKRCSRKSSLSKLLSLSDSSIIITSDSDEFSTDGKIRLNNKFNSCVKNNNIQQKLADNNNKTYDASISQCSKKNIDASSIYNDGLDEYSEFRNLIPENDKVSVAENRNNKSSSHKLRRSSFDDGTDNVQGKKSIFQNLSECCGIADINKSERDENNIPSPYISPVWEGFENANNCYDYFSLAQVEMENVDNICDSDPNKSVCRKSLLGNSKNLKFDQSYSDLFKKRDSECINKSNTDDKTFAEPFFESFSIDDGFLNDLESNVLNPSPKADKLCIQNTTPNSIRKFQRLSESDACITPVNNPNCQNITPLADYSNMKHVQLKKELEKYGLKPGISRNKAKQLLRYIYNKLHPLDNETADQQSKRLRYCERPTERSLFTENTLERDNCTGVKKVKKIPDHSYSDSNNSSETESSEISVLEESFIEEEEEEDDSETRNQEKKKLKLDLLDIVFKRVMKQDKQLHEQILLYKPLWLESLRNTLKYNGVKCSHSELMNYLDEKCITFRTQQQNGRRRHKKKGKNLTKNHRNLSQIANFSLTQ